MKSYYYFVRTVGHFQADDVVYKVAVGTSDREQAKHALLKEFCRDSGFYYEKVSDSSDKAVDLLAEGVFHRGPVSRVLLRFATISVSELYKMAVDDSFARYEAKMACLPAYFHILGCFGVILKNPAGSLREKANKPSRQRKNLNHKKMMSPKEAVCVFGLILIIFLVAGFLEGMERGF